MTLNLTDTLVVGISATALFDLNESDHLFQTLSKQDRDTAISEYRSRMLEKEDEPLAPGTGFPLVKALLKLNQYQKKTEPPLVEVVILSRNSPETGVRVLNSIRHFQLEITRSAFTAGESPVDYLPAFDVDLFLTTDPKHASKVIDSKVCAAALLREPPQTMSSLPDDQVRIAFDGDGVLFSEELELTYRRFGLDAFHKNEDANKDTPLPEGPYAVFLKKLARLQERLPGRVEYSPVRLAIVTARNSPAEMRVIKTMRHWGVYIDQAFFLGGVEKQKVLRAFRPHIFLDDQDVHLDQAQKIVPSGKVPYPSLSPLSAMEKK